MLSLLRLPTIRIMGVCKRIAVFYLAAGLLYLPTMRRKRNRGQAARVPHLAYRRRPLIVLVGYWGLMTFVPVAGPNARAISVKKKISALTLTAR